MGHKKKEKERHKSRKKKKCFVLKFLGAPCINAASARLIIKGTELTCCRKNFRGRERAAASDDNKLATDTQLETLRDKTTNNEMKHERTNGPGRRRRERSRRFHKNKNTALESCCFFLLLHTFYMLRYSRAKTVFLGLVGDDEGLSIIVRRDIAFLSLFFFKIYIFLFFLLIWCVLLHDQFKEPCYAKGPGRKLTPPAASKPD